MAKGEGGREGHDITPRPLSYWVLGEKLGERLRGVPGGWGSVRKQGFIQWGEPWRWWKMEGFVAAVSWCPCWFASLSLIFTHCVNGGVSGKGLRRVWPLSLPATVHTLMSLMANMQGATWLRVTLAACSLWANHCYFLVLPPPDHGALFFLVSAAKSVAQVRFSLLTRASRLRLLTASEGENVLHLQLCVVWCFRPPPVKHHWSYTPVCS